MGVGYTLIGLIAWVGSYFFRVATKNMTYAVQVGNRGIYMGRRYTFYRYGDRSSREDLYER